LASKKNNRRRKPRLFLKFILLLFLTCLIILIDSNTRIVTTEFELYYDNLPKPFDGFRITALSDFHASDFGHENEKLISKIAETNPDIIALTGDIIDRYVNKVPADEQFRRVDVLTRALTAIAPVFYITGNHEWHSGEISNLIKLLEANDVTVLRNKYINYESGGASIVIAGTDDPNGPADMIKPAEFVSNIYEREGDCFIVLLEHRNNNLELYSSLGVPLILCGHAHGGIIRLPFTDGLIGPSRELFPTHTNGVYSQGSTNMLVSRGVGNHTGAPRFLNNPQIVVAVLRTN